MSTIKITKLVAIASVTILLGCSQLAVADILHWKFDGDLNNTAGTFNGTAFGDAYAGTANGLVGGALVFDGDGDAVSIDQSVLQPGEYTITFWAKDDATTADGGYAALICDSEAYTNELVMYQRRSTSGKVYYGGYYNGSELVQFQDEDYQTWRLFTIELENYTAGSAAFRIYRNTTWATSKGSLAEFDGLQSDLYIGNRAGLDRSYSGLIDDLQIYNFILTAAQQDWLYEHPGSSLPIGDANLDGEVDAADAQVIASNWLATDATWDMGDFNGDKVVDDIDATLMASNWTGSASASVPEPSVFILLLSAVFACFIHGRAKRL